jgi:hypothetical protein
VDVQEQEFREGSAETSVKPGCFKRVETVLAEAAETSVKTGCFKRVETVLAEAAETSLKPGCFKRVETVVIQPVVWMSRNRNSGRGNAET